MSPLIALLWAYNEESGIGIDVSTWYQAGYGVSSSSQF